MRDQLLAKGLVSSKRARQVDREARRERKKGHGNQARKRELEAAAAERERAEREAREAQRRRARAEYEEQRAQMERALQIRHTILGNRLKGGGPVPFYHREVDGPRILRLQVSERMAHALRAGEAAIVAHNDGREVEYVVVTRRAAEKLHELAPRLVVFWVQDLEGISEPDHAFAERGWEPSLRPRRATSADLQRFRGVQT